MSERWVPSLIPNPGLSLERAHISEILASAGTRPVLIVAPSGYGKSVAVAQYAAIQPRTTIWLALDGRCPSQTELLKMVLRGAPNASVDETEESGITFGDCLEAVQRRSQALSENGALLVLDDLGSHSAGGLSEVIETARILRQSAIATVITMRSLPSGIQSVRETVLVDVSRMRLTNQEAVTFAGLLHEASLPEHEVLSLRDSCQGHAALFALLLVSELKRNERLDPSEATKLQVRQLVHEQLDSSARDVLIAASLMGEGRVLDLMGFDATHAHHRLVDAAHVLPLIRIENPASVREAKFHVHDLAAEALVDELNRMPADARDSLIEKVLTVLGGAGRVSRCLRILRRWGSDSVVLAWLEHIGQQCLSASLAAELAELFASIPVQQAMSRPSVLLTWAECCWELGDTSEALAKARGSWVLLSHSNDDKLAMKAAALTIDYYREMGQLDEAKSLTDAVLANKRQRDAWTADVIRADGAVLVALGRFEEARERLEEARSMATESQMQDVDIGSLDRLLASIPVFACGDYAGTARALSPLLKARGNRLTARALTKGNMGVCFVETGRLDRAERLLKSVVTADSRLLAAYYSVSLGCLHGARGSTDSANELVNKGIALAVEIGDESEAAVSRVYQSVLLRASDMPEHSLVSAERAFEEFAQRDYMNFRRLAALEVGASLLALGDVSAARSWAEPVVSDGFGSNQHHALRAAMILAECDRRDGDVDGAVERLRPFKDHIATENSNWQAAMYIRAFPALLGMFAEAYGVKALPSHMLRMVLPQHAERSLRLSKSFMESGTWEELGLRVLGKQQFAQLVERKGQPICHVRLFGGLEVSIDGRVVQERDWRKRKARLVFAMLAVRRGADTPRDEILDHLWPELDEERAKNNFYVAWSAMKSALMNGADRSVPSPYIESARGRCRIRAEAVRLDLDDFDEALALAREAEAAGQPRAAVSAYERMSAAYRGDVLPGDVYDDWFAPTRDNYRMQFVASMMRATELLLELDDPCEALLFVRRGLSVDPLREDLYQVALRCHILAGQRSAAIDTFLQCRSNLGDELGLDPSAETMKLYQEVLAMEERPRTDTYGLS